MWVLFAGLLSLPIMGAMYGGTTGFIAGLALALILGKA